MLNNTLTSSEQLSQRLFNVQSNKKIPANSDLLALSLASLSDSLTASASAATSRKKPDAPKPDAPTSGSIPTNKANMKDIFAMDAALVEIGQWMLENNQKLSNQSVDIGKVLQKLDEAQLEKVIKEIAEQHKHHSFWHFICHIFKAVIGCVEMIVQPEHAESIYNKNIKQGLKDLKSLGELVFDARMALNCLLVGDVKDAKKFGEKCLKSEALPWVGTILSMVMIATAALTGQPEIALIGAMLFVLSEEGVTNDMTKGIAEGLAKHMSKSAAKILADLITIVIITAFAVVTGGGAAISAGSKEVSTEVAEEVSAEVAEEVEGAASKISDQEGSRVRINGKRAAGVTCMGAASGLGQSSIAFDIINATGAKGWKKILLLIVAVLTQVAATIAATAGGTSSIMKAAEGPNSKLVQYILDNADNFKELGAAIQAGVGAAQGGVEVAQGGAKVLEGEMKKVIAQAEAAMTQIHMSMSMNDNTLSDLSSGLKSDMQTLEKMLKGFGKTVAGPGEAVAKSLLVNS
ncbi:hypothetical protein [Candidatus Neptunichlamydia sp. REUL1]|uniref:hypothetical protein n=1 Tax=Candidatus Neptunichlamydia sp. REUL1 TaxID=3064277 RepID=UPI00292F74AC|nr:hypothetical protein [Candidatus Neptunochlamydia sp. REUL1]